jgi:hypothetical protein
MNRRSSALVHGDLRNPSLPDTAVKAAVEVARFNEGPVQPETDYHLIGSGQAVVFTDGGAITASWSKAADGAPHIFWAPPGKPVSLNRGHTWYEIVPTGAAVSY